MKPAPPQPGSRPASTLPSTTRHAPTPAFGALLAPFEASPEEKQNVLRIYFRKDAAQGSPRFERFLSARNRADAAAVDIRSFSDGTVAETFTVLTSAKHSDDEIPTLLSAFDNGFLPSVELASGNLTFTVIRGEVLGNYEGTEK
jgi:hypothetical protein